MTTTFQVFDRNDRPVTATHKTLLSSAGEPFGVLRIDVDGAQIDIFTTPERARTIADAINNSLPAKLEGAA